MRSQLAVAPRDAFDQLKRRRPTLAPQRATARFGLLTETSGWSGRAPLRCRGNCTRQASTATSSAIMPMGGTLPINTTARDHLKAPSENRLMTGSNTYLAHVDWL